VTVRATVCNSAAVCDSARARQSAAVRGSAAVCGSGAMCSRVRAAVCAEWQCACVVVCGTASGSMRQGRIVQQCGSLRQCTRHPMCDSGAKCDSARVSGMRPCAP
jgi:hypothetical protein